MRNKILVSIAKAVSPFTAGAGKAALCVIASSLLLLPALCAAQEPDLLDLYRLARAKDPTLVRSDARLSSGKADKEIAWATLMPRVSANGSVKQFWSEVLGYSQPIDGQFTGYSYGVGGTLYLLNMPAYYQITAAKAGIDSAEYAVQATRQDLIVRLVDAYLRYLKSMADEKLYREESVRMGKVLEQAQAFVKAGTGDIIAVYEARSRQDSAAADVVKAEGQRKIAQQQLSSLTGTKIEGVKDVAENKPREPQTADLDWWMETMRQHNPNILQARKDLKQAEENTKGASAAYYPTIQGNGGYTVDKGSTFLPDVETRQWYASIGMSVPIYIGGEIGARTRKSLSGERERAAMLDDAQDQAVKKLQESYLNLQYNQSLVAAYRRKLESAEMQLKAVQRGRIIGSRTAIDLLNAEQAQSVSRRDLASALYDNTQRLLELKGAAGVLAESDLEDLRDK